MFSDRLWILKLLLAAGLFAVLGHRARREFAEVDPQPELAPVYFGKMRGKTVSLWARPVLASAPDGFDVQTRIGRFRVLSPERPPAGECVSVRARVAGPRTLEAIAVQRNEGVRWKRPVNYVVSVLTLLGFLFWAGRRFRWPIREGLFRSRT